MCLLKHYLFVFFISWLSVSPKVLAQSTVQSITTVAGGTGNGPGASQLYRPTAVFVDESGYIYVSDSYNHRIQKFSPNSIAGTAGTTVAGTGSSGSATNQLSTPGYIAVDESGNLFVADFSNRRIQKFPPNSTSSTPATTVAGGEYASQFPNHEIAPSGIVVEKSGNVFVSDLFKARVLRILPNLNPSKSVDIAVGGNGPGANGSGSTDNLLNGPNGMYVDGVGNLYIADLFNNRIIKFPPNSTQGVSGTVVAGGNGRGSAANQLNNPYDVSVDGSGHIYVADWLNHRIQKFPPNSTSATAGITVVGTGSRGSAPNQLDSPRGVFVDSKGSIYVADYENHRIQKYNPPVIISQPEANSGVCAGATVTAQVSASANVPLTYQWYKDNVSTPIIGQTSATLSLTSVEPAAAGSYSVVVSAGELTITSTSFELTVLDKPSASLVASGSLSSATPSVTLTASGGGTYQFSPGAIQIDNGPTATVNSPGAYSVVVTGNNGCSNVASVTVTAVPSPDLIPLLYTRPTGLYGQSPVTVVVDVLELNGVTSSGLITLKITQDSKLSLALSPTETTVNNRSVNNKVWQLSGPTNGYYVLKTSQPIPAGDKLSVGLRGTFTPGSSSGGLTVSGTLVGGSGGELRTTNNIDADKLDYFQQ